MKALDTGHVSGSAELPATYLSGLAWRKGDIRTWEILPHANKASSTSRPPVLPSSHGNFRKFIFWIYCKNLTTMSDRVVWFSSNSIGPILQKNKKRRHAQGCTVSKGQSLCFNLDLFDLKALITFHTLLEEDRVHVLYFPQLPLFFKGMS